MFRRKYAWRSVAVLGAAALVLSACGEGDGDGNGDGNGNGDAEQPFEGTLDVGVILPQSGQLAFLGPPMFAGIDVALAEINEAGGVWGNDVVLSITDEADPETPDVGVANAGTLVREDVDAVIGAAASGMTVNMIEQFRDAEIVQISPSNTGIALDDHPARDFYLRTAPSDVMQGTVLANEIIADGHETIAIIARQDAYGEGLAAQTREVYEANGGQLALDPIIYDPGAAEFSAEIGAIREADPDAIVLITFEEGERIMSGLIEQDLGPEAGTQWYLVDGNLSDWSDSFEAGAMEGAKATAPATDVEPEAFYARMDEVASEPLDAYTYGPESHDALMLIALGAIAANSDDAGEIKAAIIELSKDPGTTCTTFAECKELLEAGEEINYDGASGPFNFNDVGDISQSTIGVFEFGADNNYTQLRIEPTQLD